MENKRIFKVAVIGTIVTALCCFTPVLVILLGAVGLSSLLRMLDYVLIPALVFFIGLFIYAYVKNRRAQPPSS